jgi:hypothetical protein
MAEKDFVERLNRYAFAITAARQILGGRDTNVPSDLNKDYAQSAKQKAELISILDYYQELLEGELAHGKCVDFWPDLAAFDGIATDPYPNGGATLSSVLANEMIEHAQNIAATLASHPNTFSFGQLFLERGKLGSSENRISRMSKNDSGLEMLFNEFSIAIQRDIDHLTLCTTALANRTAAKVGADYFDKTRIEANIAASESSLARVSGFARKKLFLQKFFNILASTTDFGSSRENLSDILADLILIPEDLSAKTPAVGLTKATIDLSNSLDALETVNWSDADSVDQFKNGITNLQNIKTVWLSGEFNRIEELFDKTIAESAENSVRQFGKVASTTTTSDIDKAADITKFMIENTVSISALSSWIAAVQLAKVVSAHATSGPTTTGSGTGTTTGTVPTPKPKPKPKPAPTSIYDLSGMNIRELAEAALKAEIYSRSGKSFVVSPEANFKLAEKNFLDEVDTLLTATNKVLDSDVVIEAVAGLIYWGRWILSTIFSDNPITSGKVANNVLAKHWANFETSVEGAIKKLFNDDNDYVKSLANVRVILTDPLTSSSGGRPARKVKFFDVLCAKIVSLSDAASEGTFMALAGDTLKTLTVGDDDRDPRTDAKLSADDFKILGAPITGVILATLFASAFRKATGVTLEASALAGTTAHAVDLSKQATAMSKLPSNNTEDAYNWDPENQDLDLQNLLTNGNTPKKVKNAFGW